MNNDDPALVGLGCPICGAEPEVCAELESHEWIICEGCGDEIRPQWDECPTCGLSGEEVRKMPQSMEEAAAEAERLIPLALAMYEEWHRFRWTEEAMQLGSLEAVTPYDVFLAGYIAGYEQHRKDVSDTLPANAE